MKVSILFCAATLVGTRYFLHKKYTLFVGGIMILSIGFFGVTFSLWFKNYKEIIFLIFFILVLSLILFLFKCTKKDFKIFKIFSIKNIIYFNKIGRVAYGIFHDLYNPITAFSLSVSNTQNLLQKEGVTIDMIKNSFISISNNTDRVHKYIRFTREHLRFKDIKNRFSVSLEIQEIINTFYLRFCKNEIEFSYAGLTDLYLYGDSIKFSRVVSNLISNSIDSCIESKNTNKSISIFIKRYLGGVCVDVIDNGVGVAKNLNMFNVFYTTKKGNTGLGLSLVKSIIEDDFNGRIFVENRKNGGVIFSVFIPSYE